MRLFDLRKSLKSDFQRHGKDVVDVDFIISEVLGVSHTELVLIEEIADKDLNRIMKCVVKRLAGCPVNKIFERAYFYGREFKINEHVLAPRQDSEVLIDTAIRLIRENDLKTCLDLCTGSGCLAITVKCETGIEVVASDVSTRALTVAKQNAKLHNADIEFVKSDMFEKIDGSYDIIISNPPYIATEDIEDLDTEVKDHDPRLALDGGEFGLKFYNIIHDNLRKHLNPNGICVLEIGDEQKMLVTSLFNDFELIASLQDMSGNDRVLVFKR